MSKGQLTMFMLIGLVIVVFAALTFYLTDVMQAKVRITGVEASSAKDLVEQCLNLVAEDALITIGKQGGFAVLPEQYFSKLNASFLFDDGANNVPDILTAEQELSNHIENRIGLCIDGFDSLKGKGIIVTEIARPKVTSTISAESVRFSIDYAIEERIAGRTTRPEFLPVTKTPLRLGGMLQLADAIVESEKNNQGLFDLDVPCSLEVTHFPLDNTLITIITDTESLIQDNPYRLVFAHNR